MNRKLVVLIGLGIALVMTSARVYAQVAGAIRGLTTDLNFNSRPLDEVKVLVVQTQQTAVSDSSGIFLIEDIQPGTYTLIFSKDGFVRQVETEVVVRPGQLTELDAQMPSEFTELPPFEAQDFKLDAGSEIGLDELSQEVPEFLSFVGEEQMQAAGASTAADGLKLVSGATVNDDKAVIRGLPDRYVNSQVNSIRFPSADAETRSLELDQFPSDVIESILVSKTFTPDQQGDASGGAVNIILKGIPDQDIFKIGGGTTYNSNYTGRNDFRTYQGGGLSVFGIDNGRQTLPSEDPSPVALGTQTTQAPYDYSTNMTLAKRHEFVESGWTIGGVVSTFYDRGGDFYDDGVQADYAVDFLNVTPFSDPGAAPRAFFLPDVGGSVALLQPDPRSSSVFDVIKSTEEVQWGGLGAFGMENEYNKIDFIFLQTRTTQDTTFVNTDTRTRGIVESEITALQSELAPFDFLFSGITGPDAAGSDLAFVRNQTLEYQERMIRSAQIRGEHTLTFFDDSAAEDDEGFRLLNPILDWTYAHSDSSLREPDQRVFRSIYNPDAVSQSVFALDFSSAANVGYAQRSWENITESSDQVQVNLKMPFVLPNQEEGSLKVGLFRDRVKRTFDRETFTTESGVQLPPNGTLPAGVDFTDFFLTDLLNDAEKSVNFADPSNDVDFNGNYDIDAFYFMLDVPITAKLRAIGGARFESTKIGIGLTNIDEFAQSLDLENNSADPLVVGGAFPGPGVRQINPDTGLFRGDVDFSQDDILPSITLIYEPTETLTFRAAYSQTIARATFRELTAVRQQEFLGSTQFFGNEQLKFSDVTNYDFKADYRPAPGSLISVSAFYKDIKDPIEYIAVTGNNVFAGSVTYPVNFPEGSILGGEFEVRQDVGEIWEAFTGLTLGGNATLIESEVIVADDQATVPIGQRSRPMLNAPDMLLNLFAVYRNEETGTEIGLFYTVRGDTLVRGATPALTDIARFTPNIFETQYDTLNLTFSQQLTEHLRLRVSAKNLTNPDIQRVYRSPFSNDVVHSSYNKGISLSVSLSASFEF